MRDDPLLKAVERLVLEGKRKAFLEGWEAARGHHFAKLPGPRHDGEARDRAVDAAYPKT